MNLHERGNGMLNLMRKQAGSWMIKIILFAICVVFVFWGVGSFNARRKNTVANINGEIITYDAYRQAYNKLREQYHRAYGEAFNDEMAKNLHLEDQALDQIVNRTLMLQEAKRLNIQAADLTIDRAIFNIPAFQINGVFNEGLAKQVLAENRMTTSELRDSFRQNLILSKLQAMMVDGVVATQPEAKEWYDWYNAQVDLTFVPFLSDRYKDITVTDKQIADYFKSHDNKYRTEPQVKVRYLFFDPDSYKDQVKITPEEVAEYYSSHPEEFKTEKTVVARHILLKLDENADPEKVAEKKKEAIKIYKLAKAGKDFAELAKRYSEGPTREQGGYLGEFKHDAMVKPFADKAFSMQAGEISEPVRTRFGWHIIKVEKVNQAHSQSLADATKGIREKLINKKARELAQQKAEEIYDDTLYDGANLTDVAKKHQVPVETTDLFTPQGPKNKDIGDVKLFADTAFGLEKMGISDVKDLGNGYCLMQVIDRIESTIPALETVKDRVKHDLVATLQDERAKADAEAFLAELKKGKSMAQADAPSDAKPDQTGFFTRTGAIPKIGYEPAISRAAFELGPAKRLPDQVFKGRQGWYVIQLKERKLPAMEGFEKQKSNIEKRLTEQKRQTALGQWLADLRTRGKVDINRKLIE
jgi:peptidyl-prolyl cis-trans isomerase D